MAESDNRKAEDVREAAIVLEPVITVANQILDMARDVRKRLGRDVSAVWMPPQAYCVKLIQAQLPSRTLDEVVGMGLSSGFPGVDGLELRLDSPVLERQNDGSMLVVSRVWSESPDLQKVIDATTASLLAVGVESVEGDVASGLRLVMGWIPGPCGITSIPEGNIEGGSMTVAGVVAGMLEPVESTPMTTCRRVRTVYFGDFEKSEEQRQ